MIKNFNIKHLVIIFLVLIQFPLLSSGQITENDTVFVKRTVHTENIEIDTIIIPGGISPAKTDVLIGTTFLPYSDKMIGLLNNGLSPIKLEVIKECDNTFDPETTTDYPQFVEVSRDSNVLSIDVSIVANCCHNFLGEAEVTGNDTLNLLYTSYGGFCSCDCYFTLRYKFDSTMENHYQTLKYTTINGSRVAGKIPNRKKTPPNPK